MRNDAGVFSDITEVTGARMQGAANAVDRADMDGDGDLDAFIGGRYERDRGRARRNYLFEQVAPLRFRDIAPAKALSAAPPGGQNVFLGSWMDYDADGDPDLLVAIDYWGAELYRNDRGSFAQVTTRVLPPATDETPGAPPNNAMGAAWGDYDNDGCFDVFITGVNIPGQGGFEARHLTDLASRLYRNTCDGTFENATLPSGFRPTGMVEWAANFIDYDNDGDLDLSVVTGYPGITAGDGVSTRADQFIGLIVKYPRQLIPARLATWLYRYEAMIPAAGQSGPEAAMPKLLYRNQLVETGKATFVDVSYSLGIANVSASRASLWADMDNDGDLDWFVPGRRTANRLFRNDGPVGRHLRVHLVGARHRQAIGAGVRIRVGGRQQLRHVHIMDGYLSQSQLDPHFGLGQATTVEEIAVRWPGTTTWVTACRNVPAGRTVTVREGGGCSW